MTEGPPPLMPHLASRDDYAANLEARASAREAERAEPRRHAAIEMALQTLKSGSHQLIDVNDLIKAARAIDAYLRGKDAG